jgi:phospholipase/lecithinase/hemolysin
MYSGVTVFGDSLTDTGNVLALTSIFQPPPFPNFTAAPGRFSDGPVWIEHLATGLGHPAAALPSHLIYNGSSVVPIGAQGGTNYAYGGARTGLGGSAGGTTGLLGQWIAWNGSTAPQRAADPDALYVVLAGANDMRDLRSGSAGAISPTQAAVNVVQLMAALANAGARHFLVGNLPDLGLTPEAVAANLVPQSTVATLSFNASLAAALSILDNDFLAAYGVDLDIVELNLYGLMQSVVNDAKNNGGAVYGITNVTTPCITPVQTAQGPVYYTPGAIASNCDTSLFSDPLHPSSAGHRLLGAAALAALDANAVPEPAMLALVCLGLAAAAATSRRRRKD